MQTTNRLRKNQGKSTFHNSLKNYRGVLLTKEVKDLYDKKVLSYWIFQFYLCSSLSTHQCFFLHSQVFTISISLLSVFSWASFSYLFPSNSFSFISSSCFLMFSLNSLNSLTFMSVLLNSVPWDSSR